MAMTEGFYIFLISSSFAFLTFIGRMCYKSKCSEIKCFGVKICTFLGNKSLISFILP